MMDDIELRNIEPDQPLIRSLSRADSFTSQVFPFINLFFKFTCSIEYKLFIFVGGDL